MPSKHRKACFYCGQTQERVTQRTYLCSQVWTESSKTCSKLTLLEQRVPSNLSDSAKQKIEVYGCNVAQTPECTRLVLNKYELPSLSARHCPAVVQCCAPFKQVSTQLPSTATFHQPVIKHKRRSFLTCLKL